jgi:hypothetical protein
MYHRAVSKKNKIDFFNIFYDQKDQLLYESIVGVLQYYLLQY